MIEMIWFGIVGLACLVALANWRAGLYIGILLDCVRDPVRKLTDDQTVLVTLTGAAVWGVVILRAITQEHSEVLKIFGRYPQLKTMASCLMVAVVPAAVLSMVLYPGGYLLAAIGSVSYVAPCIGIALGYLVPRSEGDVYRLLCFYCIVNCIVLIGVPLEYLEYDLPALGGIEMEWLRYREGYTVDLMCGFYRSPDIMGLHAAHVIMFSLILAVKARPEYRFTWSGLAMWAMFCVLVSGRRKMIGIPLVFLAVYLGLGMIRRVRTTNTMLQMMVILGIIGGAMSIFFWSPDESAEYTDFATSMFTEGGDRANSLIVESSVGTLQQVGLLGAGIGTATQGRYYVKVGTGQAVKGWQEDGVSRLILEFGVPGFLLLIWSALMFLVSLYYALTLLPRESSEQLLQIGLMSIVFGDAASYAISHQQFSGDPVSGLIVTLLAGMVLGMPRAYARRINDPAAAIAGLSLSKQRRAVSISPART